MAVADVPLIGRTWSLKTGLEQILLLAMQTRFRRGQLKLKVEEDVEAMGKWGVGYDFGRGCVERKWGIRLRVCCKATKLPCSRLMRVEMLIRGLPTLWISKHRVGVP